MNREGYVVVAARCARHRLDAGATGSETIASWSASPTALERAQFLHARAAVESARRAVIEWDADRSVVRRLVVGTAGVKGLRARHRHDNRRLTLQDHRLRGALRHFVGPDAVAAFPTSAKSGIPSGAICVIRRIHLVV